MSIPFEPLLADKLHERYGDFFRDNIDPLDPEQVPAILRGLIPYAQLWGVGDDYERDQLVDSAPSQARQDLLDIFSTQSFVRAVDQWLAGPEADGPKYSRAYIAFSNLRIAFDYLSVQPTATDSDK